MSSSSVATMSSGESWDSMTTTSSPTSWLECTVVTTGVVSGSLPSARKIAVSRSAKPAPLPVRPPARLTATEPTTQKSMMSTSSKPMRSPCSTKPCEVAASSKEMPFSTIFLGSMRR